MLLVKNSIYINKEGAIKRGFTVLQTFTFVNGILMHFLSSLHMFVVCILTNYYCAIACGIP